jgi:hypothetical protein
LRHAKLQLIKNYSGFSLTITTIPVASAHVMLIANTITYDTIGRYLALPTGSIGAGQNSQYFDNYMQEGKYGLGKYDSIFARLLFPNLFRAGCTKLRLTAG